MLNLQVKLTGTIYNINNFLKIDTNFYVKVEEEKKKVFGEWKVIDFI